jgi:hypothetical protein
MQRIFILFFIIALNIVAASAQTAVKEAVFNGKYRNNKNATETIVEGDALERYKLNYYRGVTIKNQPEDAAEIEAAVIKDGKNANDKEVSYKDGHLYYGLYSFKRALTNRYIFYLNQHLKGGNKIVVIYMVGDAKLNDIKKLIQK